jgi:hypothetical protein
MIYRHALGAVTRRLAAALLCVSLLLIASQSFAAAFVAQAVKVRGDVRISRDGAGDMSCSMGTALQLGDVVATGPGARLRLRFVDGSILALGENTKLSVDLFAVDASNKSRTVVLTVLEGIVNAAAAKSGESNFDYQIKTANGYSAVRGTKWIVALTQAAMNVYVLNGVVEMGGSSSEPVLVNAGQWGSVDPSGKVSAVQPTTPQMLQPVLDATADTAGLAPSNPTVPNPILPTPTVPSQTVPPPPTGPKQNPRAEKGDKSHEKYGGEKTH